MYKKLTMILTVLLGMTTMVQAREHAVHQQTVSPQDSTVLIHERWSLQDCIDYALEQNLTIRQNRLSTETAKIDVDNARSNYLPNVSGSVSQRLVNKPWNENSTQINGDIITTSSSRTSYSGNYSVDVNWTLFSASRANTIRQRKLNSEVSELNVSTSENDVIESIFKLYIQILYGTEAIKVQQETLNTSTRNYERGLELFKVGSMSKADLAQLESQVSQDKYQLVVTQTDLANYKMQLKQLLGIIGGGEIEIVLENADEQKALEALPEKQDIYEYALASRPEIRAAELDIQSSELGEKIAKAGYAPTLSMNAGIGTSNMNGSDFSFSEQVKQNWNNSLGLSASIPIFDRNQTSNSVKKSKIETESSRLSLLSQQKDLYKTVESLWLDANSAQQQYLSARDRVASNQTSLMLVQEQFNVGMKNTIELLTEMNNLLSAQQQMLQAKYTALMNIQLLNYYGGRPIKI